MVRVPHSHRVVSLARSRRCAAVPQDVRKMAGWQEGWSWRSGTRPHLNWSIPVACQEHSSGFALIRTPGRVARQRAGHQLNVYLNKQQYPKYCMGQIEKKNSLFIWSPSLRGYSLFLFAKFGNPHPPSRESFHNGFYPPRNFRWFHIFVLLISTYKYFIYFLFF